MKRKLVFKADCIGKTISIFPSLRIYANCAKPGWSEWAVELGWLCWYVGFKVIKK